MTDMTEIMFWTLTDWVFFFFFINFILNCSLQCTIEMQKREHIHYLEVFIEFCVIHIHIFFLNVRFIQPDVPELCTCTLT